MGERDLTVLLQTMQPVLHEAPHGYAVWTGGVPPFATFATVAEDEGLTVIAELAALRAAGLTSAAWARISLTVQSDLAAVGLTAAIATVLTDAGISANVVAGYHHDHLFVQWEARHRAMAALESLSRG